MGVTVALATSSISACKGANTRSPNVEVVEEREDRWARLVGENLMVAYCSPELRGEVDALFELLLVMSLQGMELQDGSRVPLGWTTLVVGREGEDLVLFEPDYEAEDPESTTRADVSATLRILSRQLRVAARIEVRPQPVNFDQHVLMVKGSLDVDNVYMLRVESPGARLSGWRLHPTEGDHGDAELESLPIYEVYRRRPELVEAMLLPPGYMAFFGGKQLQVLVDGDDQPVWQREQSAPIDAETPSFAPLVPDPAETR